MGEWLQLHDIKLDRIGQYTFPRENGSTKWDCGLG
jgi:hypothetical protein